VSGGQLQLGHSHVSQCEDQYSGADLCIPVFTPLSSWEEQVKGRSAYQEATALSKDSKTLLGPGPVLPRILVRHGNGVKYGTEGLQQANNRSANQQALRFNNRSSLVCAGPASRARWTVTRTPRRLQSPPLSLRVSSVRRRSGCPPP
jgi:hypothetical protein